MVASMIYPISVPGIWENPQELVLVTTAPDLDPLEPELYVRLDRGPIRLSVIVVGEGLTEQKARQIKILVDSTGGVFHIVTGMVLADSTPPKDWGPDSDGDGVYDSEELAGSFGYRGFGATDPNNPDTDGDGLTDGEELNPWTSPYLENTIFYEPVSNPNKKDSDNDGLDDLTELVNGFSALDRDQDADGLDDQQEFEAGTADFFSDTDTDGYADGLEVSWAAQGKGFDPLAPDVEVTAAEYIDEFLRGTLCGDVVGFGDFCRGGSTAYLIGQIVGGIGFLTVADVRDMIGSAINGDKVSFAFSAAALIPLLGDGAKLVKQADNFALATAKLAKQAANAGDLRKLEQCHRALGDLSPAKPKAFRKALDELNPGAVTRVTKKWPGVDAKDVEKFIGGAMRMGWSPKHAEDVLMKAKKVAKLPAAKKGGPPANLRLEKDAESWLKSTLPGAEATKRGLDVAGTGKRNQRYMDIIDSGGRNPSGIASELKIGPVPSVGRAKGQMNKDITLLGRMKADPKLATDLRFKKIEWVFFAKESAGQVGCPDPKLLDLVVQNGIEYTVYLGRT
jgi:hypothetical protein